MAYDEDDDRAYVVLINDEEQYSLWLKEVDVPTGWRTVGKEGSRKECVQFVDDTWKDMRPLSLRQKMDGG